MKNARKLLFAVAFATLMPVAMSTSAFAAEVDNNASVAEVAESAVTVDDNMEVVPLSYTNHTTVKTDGKWVPIASDGGGFNCNAVVSIPLLDGFSYKVDIGLSGSMLQVTPTTVVNDAFGKSSTSRTVPLGTNKVLFIRISQRTALGGGASSYAVNTTVNK